MGTQPEARGRQLLSAVERLVADDATLRGLVASAEARMRERHPEASKAELREAVVKELTRSASNRAALAGGAAGLPSLLPGLGSLAAGVAGTFAELTYLLKTETELCLCLSHAYGFDISEPRERQLAFLLAAVGTYDASGGNFFVDLARAEGTAVWNYGPRVASRTLLKVLTAVAGFYVWRGFLKMIPAVGIALGGGLNKVLTQRVGVRAARDLSTRRALEQQAKPKAKAKAPRRKKKPAAPKLKLA